MKRIGNDSPKDFLNVDKIIKDALEKYLNEGEVLESKLSRMSEPEFEMFKANIDEAHSRLTHVEQIIIKEDKIMNEQKTDKGEAVWIVDKKTGNKDKVGRREIRTEMG
jgi:hypothetical protein